MAGVLDTIMAARSPNGQGTTATEAIEEAMCLLHRIAENTENTVQSREQYGQVPLAAQADGAGAARITWNLPAGFIFVERFMARSSTTIVWTCETFYDTVDPANSVDLVQPGGTGRVARVFQPRLIVPEHRQALVFDVTGLAANGFIYLNLQYQQVQDDALAKVTGDTSTG